MTSSCLVRPPRPPPHPTTSRKPRFKTDAKVFPGTLLSANRQQKQQTNTETTLETDTTQLTSHLAPSWLLTTNLWKDDDGHSLCRVHSLFRFYFSRSSESEIFERLRARPTTTTTLDRSVTTCSRLPIPNQTTPPPQSRPTPIGPRRSSERPIQVFPGVTGIPSPSVPGC